MLVTEAASNCLCCTEEEMEAMRGIAFPSKNSEVKPWGTQWLQLVLNNLGRSSLRRQSLQDHLLTAGP